MLAHILAALLSFSTIWVTFGLTYLLTACFYRAWWHVPIVSVFTFILLSTLFSLNRYLPWTADELFARALATLVYSLLAYFSMGLPSFKRKARVGRPVVPASGTVEQRLVELQALLDKQLVSAEEYAAARKRIIESV